MSMRRHWLWDIVVGLWSIANGLAVTLRNTARPRVTLDYPAKPVPIFPRYRGRLQHLRDETGRLKCTACLACQKACPTIALPTIEGDDKKGKEKRAKTYLWDAGRCLFCGYCVEACPFDAIRMTMDYSVVGETREALHLGLEQLLEPRGGAE
jgi:NADH-quinone oxidoreductase subunit I